MATTFKTLGAKDVVSTRQLLHEAIPVTGTIVSGTYSDENVKNYSHGMFQSVYDYPYLSSSANHIFDLTVGYAASSVLSSSTATQNSKKINLYNQMSQVLMGFDITGAVNLLDEDGDLSGGTKMRECFFLNFARLLTKDEIKKGSFNLQLGVSSSHANPFRSERIKLSDRDAATEFKVNSPAGEYGILYATNEAGNRLVNPSAGTKAVKAGLLFYQAGVAVITGSVFGGLLSGTVQMDGFGQNVDAVLTGSVISASCDSFRRRMYNMSFNNTTELNSTIYFCRVNNNDFNYSSNPTYLTASKIRTKENVSDPPVAYITTVGLYSPDNQLLAVGKVSEPLKKDPTDEFTLRVRLDY
tara:strand:- start:2079 stop:3143 length:1065 start_codon:yes stop_codon:yes gene_type:complete